MRILALWNKESLIGSYIPYMSCYHEVVPEEGLEPSHITAFDFESSASTIPPLRLLKFIIIITQNYLF
jgi:hypothetical protein